MKSPFTYVVILLTLSSLTTFSQGLTDSLIQQMYGMWNSAYLSYEIDHVEGSLETTHEYLKLSDSVVSRDALKAKLLKAESDLVNKDWGLDWSAAYLYNTSAGIDVADNILYKSRIQTQVSWNILNNGLVENNHKSKILLNKSYLAELEENNQNFVSHDILDNWHKVIYRFNQDKIQVLNQRLLLAEKRVDISYQLQSLGKITHAELLNNLESYAEISSLYKIYEDYNNNISEDIGQVTTDPLPLIDIDYSYGIEKLESTISDSAKQLMLENLELENKFINDVKLNVYSRYNYYDLINNPIENREFLTLGVGVGIPITFSRKEKDELISLKKQQIEQGEVEENIDQVRLKNDMLSYLYEFRYKLKQFNGFYYKKLKLEEMLRKEQARFDVNRLDFNPLKALRWLDESMAVDIELIDIKQQLYLYVLKMLSIAPQLEVESLVKPLVLDDIEIVKVQKAAKEVYVWSKTLENHTTEMLIHYCVVNNISKVVVSASSDKAKFNAFALKCKEYNVMVEAMIGDNQLINDYSESKLASKLDGIDLSLIQAIHLDVEPQTFDDWSEKREIYANQYLDMFDAVDSWAMSRSLKTSVSLPTYFPEEAIREIQEMNGQLYFMCYENVTASFLEKKLGKYINSDFVIALRPEDFNNVAEMEDKITELTQLLNPKKFIIHDLERLLKFDP